MRGIEKMLELIAVLFVVMIIIIALSCIGSFYIGLFAFIIGVISALGRLMMWLVLDAPIWVLLVIVFLIVIYLEFKK